MADEKKRKKKTGEKPVEKMRSMHDEVVKDFLSENETARAYPKSHECFEFEIVGNRHCLFQRDI